MLGILFSLIAGIFMSLQGVLNTRASEKIGLWEINAFVQGTAFIATMIILFFAGDGNFKKITELNKIYLIGGLLGVVITYAVMRGISSLGPTYSIATILIAQLVSAAIIDMFGLFGTDRLPFHYTKIIGVVIMIIGIILFKYKG